MKLRNASALVFTLISALNFSFGAETKNATIKYSFWSYLKSPKKMPVVNNHAVKQHCGECHWVVLPGLLPSQSWKKLMDGLDEHFDDPVTLDNATKEEILMYLQQNSSEKTNSKVSMKITRSTAGVSPIAVSKIRYIKKKHDDIKDKTWNHPDVKFRGNCIACHRKAEKTGVFSGFQVKVPKN